MSKGPKFNQRSLQVQATAYQGPLPQPSDLEKYNVVVPGAAERIIAMAERQAGHRQSLEKTAITSEINQARLGTFCALIIGLFGLGIAGYTINSGHDAAGAAIGTTALASIVSSFIYGSSKRRSERQEQSLPARR